MADEITLTEELYDRRDPKRPPVFVAPKGAKISRALAELLGVEVPKPAVKARKEADVEDKAVKPASTKRTKKD